MAGRVNLANLCKEALKILADSDDPIKLIEDAKEEAGKEDPWSRKDVFVNDEYGEKLGFPGMFRDFIEYKGWKIIKHITPLGHYVLIDSNSIVYAKYLGPNWRGKNLQLFLELLISLAPIKEPTMIIYHVVTDEEEEIKGGCKRLTEENAYKKFPNSIDLGSGFFAIHPKDKKALVPLDKFFSKIAVNQQYECVELLCKMGAKSVHITTFDESKDKKGGQIKAGSKELNFEAGMSINSELEKFSELKVNFKGISDFTPDILEKSVWFKTNGEMKSILKMRLAKNTLIEQDVTTEVNETFKFDFKAAANVLGVVEADLKVDYEKATKQKKNFHVIFGE